MWTPRKLCTWLLLVTLFVVLVGIGGAPRVRAAGNPGTIAFQGKVVNANGTNVTDANYKFVFSLYTVASGGTAVWTETQPSVAVASGVFQVSLGSVCSFTVAATCNNNTPVDFNADNTLYLGITFNNDAAGEMTPRVQMQSVPYAYNADKVGGLSVSQLVQLSPAAQQTGFINVSGNGTFGGGVTATGTVQGATVTSTGALQGNSLSLNSGAFAVSSAGAITASTGLTDTGSATVQNATYTTNMVLVNDGQTSPPPTFPYGYTPALTVLTSEVSGSRPLFFGYNAGGSYGAFLDSGACGAFTQMCLDLGNGSASYTALENNGTTLQVGGGDDGNYTYLGLLASGGVGVGTSAPSSLFSVGTSSQFQVNASGAIAASTAITNSGLYDGDTLTNAALGFSAAAANTISGTSNQSLTIQSQGTGQLLLASASATLGLGASTSTIQRIATGMTTIDLDDSGTTTLQLENSGSGVANLNLYGGSLETGTSPVIRLTNAGALTNITTIGASGLETLSGTAATELAVTGAPAATATVSLVQYGGAITGGNNATNGGTYLGLNEPASGAGSAADFANFQNNSVSKFKVASNGSLSFGGSLSGGEDIDTKATETANATYSETTPAVAYYLSANDTTTAANVTTTFNITGLPAVDGTLASITAVSTKGATGITAYAHTTTIEINATVVATLPTVSNAATETTTRSFTVMRINGIWAVVGEGPTAALGTTSTLNTADYAEYVHYDGDLAPGPGSVLDAGSLPNSVSESAEAEDPKVLGVVSTTPYEVAGADDGHSVIIALTGRVPVTVNLQNGPIAIGDPLTASSVPGVAMKATSSGQIIGKALSAYDGSQSSPTVSVQLGIGYDDPASSQAAAESSDPEAFLDSSTAAKTTGTVPDFSTSTTQTAATARTVTASPVVSTAAQNSALSQGLVIDTSSASTPTASAITIKNDGGAGYSDLISSPDFTVSGSGFISATGLGLNLTKSTAFTLSNGYTQVASIDANGNASFSGNLSLANATLSGGLIVSGDTTFQGLSTFQKLATFVGKTVFQQDAAFQGHITLASDSAGYASLRTGESTVHVSFKTAYDSPPIVSATTSDGQFLSVAVSNITSTGFDIALSAPAKQPTTLSWTAVAVSGPQTAANPAPNPPPVAATIPTP